MNGYYLLRHHCGRDGVGARQRRGHIQPKTLRSGEWAYCCRTNVIDPAVQFIQFFKDLFELPAFQEVALAVEKHRRQEQMRILRVQAEGPDL
jgi:hypothetical protein